MAFDGRDYRDADFIFPASYHPHAPLAGPSLSRALKSAYFRVRRHTRIVIDQNIAVNHRAPATSMASVAMAVTSYTRIAEGYRYIPDAVTHLSGEAIFTILGGEDVSRVRHRVVAVGAGTDTGTATDIEIAAEQILTDARDLRASEYSMFAPSAFVHRIPFEVALSNAPAGAVTNVYVEAYATDIGGSTAHSYFMHHCSVWTEIRD